MNQNGNLVTGLLVGVLLGTAGMWFWSSQAIKLEGARLGGIFDTLKAVCPATAKLVDDAPKPKQK